MDQLQIVRAALLVNDRLCPFEQRIVGKHADEAMARGEQLTCTCNSCVKFRAIYLEAVRPRS